MYIFSKNKGFVFMCHTPSSLYMYFISQNSLSLKNLWIWCPPFFHTIHQCSFCVKVLSKGYAQAKHKNPMSNTIVRLPLMQIHVQQNGLRYCKDLPGNPNQFLMVLDFRLDFNTEAKGKSQWTGIKPWIFNMTGWKAP